MSETSSAPDAQRARLAIIAVGASLYALSGPGQTVGFSVFVDPIRDAFGLSRQGVALVYLVATLLAAPTGILIGRQIDRRSPATMINLIGLGLAASLAVAAAAPTVLVLALAIVGMRAFGQTGLILTSSVFVARSISSGRGAALGAVVAVGGATISLTPLFTSRLLPSLGWRWSWAMLSLTVLVATMWVSTRRTVNRDDGEGRQDAHEHSTDTPLPPVVADRAQQRWGFITVAAGFGTVALVGTALGFHQVALLGERGLTPSQAATNFLPQSVAAACTAVIVGRLVDRVPGRAVIPASMTAVALALLSIRLVDGQAAAIVFAMFLGMSVASMSASEGALLVRWTGTDGLGRRRGVLMSIVVVCSAVAPLLLSVLADLTGSLTDAATAAVVVPVAAALVALAAPFSEASPSATSATPAFTTAGVALPTPGARS